MRPRSPTERLIARYLADVDRALATLPGDRRRQIVDELAAHIAEARAGLDKEDPVAVKALLSRMGDPHEIAAAAGADHFGENTTARGDGVVPWLLLLGGFLFAIGWFVGVALLWASPTWRRADKLLGTLVLPGGLALAFALLSFPAPAPACITTGDLGRQAVTHCATTGLVLPLPVSLLMLAIAVLAPLFTAVHLQRARRRHDLDGRARSAW